MNPDDSALDVIESCWRLLLLTHLLVHRRDRHDAHDIVCLRLIAPVHNVALFLVTEDGVGGRGPISLGVQLAGVKNGSVKRYQGALNLADVLSNGAGKDVGRMDTDAASSLASPRKRLDFRLMRGSLTK